MITRPRQAADDSTCDDPAPACEHHGDRNLVQRHHQRVSVLAGVAPAGLQRRRQGRQEQFRNGADARQNFPQCDEGNDDETAQGC
jgi:hypothetical protein